MRKKVSKYDEDLLETYFRQIKAFPLLTFEEELQLSKQIQKGDNCALHKLINSNLRLVVKIAGLFNVPEIPILDIIQEGNIGLLHAAKKFDYRKNVRFCTYSSWWIRQFISRFITNKRRLVRLPQRKEEALRKIQRTYSILCQTLMHQPSSFDIAKELGISVHDVESFINITNESLLFEHGSNDDSVGTMDIHEDYTYSPERSLMKQVSCDGTMRVLSRLSNNERHIISYRYQLNGCERRTLREIGDRLDISPETVRQIEMRALKKIRKHADELREYVYIEAI